MTRRITFESDGCGGTNVLINGIWKARISSGSERYLSVVTGDTSWGESTWEQRKTIARFKYNKPMQHAKEFCKIVFTALDMKTVESLINRDQIAPLILQQRIQAGEIFSQN